MIGAAELRALAVAARDAKEARATPPTSPADAHNLLQAHARANVRLSNACTPARILALLDAHDAAVALVMRWDAIDGGSWAVERHARETDELKADTRTFLAEVQS